MKTFIAVILGALVSFNAQAEVVECHATNNAGGNIYLLSKGLGYATGSSGEFYPFEWVYVESTESIIAEYTDGDFRVYKASIFTCTSDDK